jgi:hypothetical protein
MGLGRLGGHLLKAANKDIGPNRTADYQVHSLVMTMKPNESKRNDQWLVWRKTIGWVFWVVVCVNGCNLFEWPAHQRNSHETDAAGIGYTYLTVWIWPARDKLRFLTNTCKRQLLIAGF